MTRSKLSTTLETIMKPGFGETPKSDNVFRVSHSKAGTWRRCRRAYWYKYVMKLRRKKKSRPLQFGTMVHSMLEAFANGDDPFELLDEMAKTQGKLFRAEVEAYGDIVEDVRCIMTEYFEYWDENSLVFQRINKKSAEHKFEIELRDGIMLVGKIDAKAWTPNKLSWIVEHKSFGHGGIPNEDVRWRNTQSTSYTRVNDILGWKPVDGTCWDYLWSKAPSKPEILEKSGKMSKRGINTLPSRVLETLKEHDLNPADFKLLLESATKNRGNYFARIFNPTKKRVVDMLWADLLETATEMAELHGKVKSRTIDKHCSWCDFEPICRAELQGSDADYITEKEYYVDKEDHSQDWADAATEAS